MNIPGAPRSGHEPPKYRTVIDSLLKDVSSGKFRPGERFPSEADLVKQFHVSRITAGRAVRELARSGVVERRAGSGTYLLPSASARSAEDRGPFGLLIPDLGKTEIFDPICRGMAGATESSGHPLLWGHAPARGEDPAALALQLCYDYVRRGVSGVFFAPLEFTPGSEEMNLRILGEFDRARIAVVLLDRSALPFPRRTPHDLIGIDNHRAGYLVTQHLLRAGAKRIAFLAREQATSTASTIDARAAGYREALWTAHPGAAPLADRLPQIDIAGVRGIMEARNPDAFVCGNDRIAGELMHQLLALGYQIPRDVRLAGIDDAGYAALLPVPLTTIHQPCREIGEAAMAAMTARLQKPDLLPRDILLACRLVIRKSCGGTPEY